MGERLAAGLAAGGRVRRLVLAGRSGPAPLRWSTPAPGGLPGGYPVLIANGAVTLDLPPGLTRQDAIAFNDSMARGDGIEAVDDDGTVHFTAACRDAVAGLGAGLAEPLAVDDLRARAAALDAVLSETRLSGPP